MVGGIGVASLLEGFVLMGSAWADPFLGFPVTPPDADYVPDNLAFSYAQEMVVSWNNAAHWLGGVVPGGAGQTVSMEAFTDEFADEGTDNRFLLEVTGEHTIGEIWHRTESRDSNSVFGSGTLIFDSGGPDPAFVNLSSHDNLQLRAEFTVNARLESDLHLIMTTRRANAMGGIARAGNITGLISDGPTSAGRLILDLGAEESGKFFMGSNNLHRRDTDSRPCKWRDRGYVHRIDGCGGCDHVRGDRDRPSPTERTDLPVRALARTLHASGSAAQEQD